MTRLIALVFDDEFKADEARAALHRMGDAPVVVDATTTMLARRKDGSMLMSQDVVAARREGALGHIVGLVAAAVAQTRPMTLVPSMADELVALLAADPGARAFVGELGQQLLPGRSALVMLGSPRAPHGGAVHDRLRGWNPRVLQTDLPATLVELMDARLSRTATAADLSPVR